MTQDLLFAETPENTYDGLEWEAYAEQFERDEQHRHLVMEALHAADPGARREAYQAAIALLERDDIKLTIEELVRTDWRNPDDPNRVTGVCLYGACLKGVGIKDPESTPSDELYGKNLFPELESAILSTLTIPEDENGYVLHYESDSDAQAADIITFANDAILRGDKARAITLLKLALARTYVEDAA